MVLRSWQCKNKRCRHSFDSWDGAPACPACGCVAVGWVPGGGHVGTTKALDASLKALAKSYGMSDMGNSPSRTLGRAMPKHDMPVADGPVLNFAPGFAAPFHTGGRATCEPSRSKVDFKVKMEAEKQLTPQFQAGPQIGASNWKTMRKAYKP